MFITLSIKTLKRKIKRIGGKRFVDAIKGKSNIIKRKGNQ